MIVFAFLALGFTVFSTVSAREVSITPPQAWFSNQSDSGEAVVTVWYDDEGQTTPAVRGFHIEITYPAGSAHVAQISEGDFLAHSGGTVAFFAEAEGGRITVNAAILGSTGGATGEGSLFTVTFDGQGVTQGCDDLEFDEASCVIRDLQNNDLTASFVDGWISHDTSGPQQPSLSSSTHPEGQTTASGIVQVQWSAVTDVPPGCAAGVQGYYLLANQTATTVPGPGQYQLFVAAGNPCTGSFTLADGEGYYVHIAAYDAVGNSSAADHYGPFGIDTTAPGNVTGLQAVTDHNRVALSWTPPADASYVRIYRKAWSYPEFDDATAQPQPPAFVGDGVLVGQYPVAITQAVDTFTDLQRNYYVYAAYAFDGAANHSAEPAPPSAQDWALSYWLGDFDNDYAYDCTLGGYDGYVDVADLNAFSAVFGRLHGEPGYCAEMDIGPTSDHLETGYPETDNEVGFEDMMIFSLTFGNVEPLAMMAGAPTEQGVPSFSLEITTDPTAPDGALIAVLEVSENGGFKGLRAEVSFDTRALEFTGADASDLLRDAGRGFLAARPGRGRVEIDLARLGRALLIEGDGALVQLRFRRLVLDPARAGSGGLGSPAPPPSPVLEALDVRDARNEPLEARIVTPDGPGPGDLPVRVSFRGAEPNPTRGEATLRWALPAEAPVRLELLDITGRRVRVLLNQSIPAGEQSFVWDGRDASGSPAPSGLYFVRLSVGGRTWVRHLLMMR